jgi:hypothetical protein
LEKAILSTVVYFDIFDFPLTPLEIWKWLFFAHPPHRSYNCWETQSCLNDSAVLQKLIQSKNGFYFLLNRERIVGRRVANYKVAERKYKKAIRFIKLLRFNPFIKMVAVCNNLAFSNASQYSDIDFFIITKAGRIWLARFWANFLPKMLGLRPTHSDTQDKLCLTFFIAEDHLNINDLQSSQIDLYLANWITQLVPVYDPDHLCQSFLQTNQWAISHFPNFIPNQPNYRRQVDNNLLSFSWRSISKFFTWGPLGNGAEQLAKKIQLAFLPQHLKKMANQDTKVVVSDSVLKFHDNDRRSKFKEMFEDKMVKVISNE